MSTILSSSSAFESTPSVIVTTTSPSRSTKRARRSLLSKAAKSSHLTDDSNLRLVEQRAISHRNLFQSALIAGASMLVGFLMGVVSVQSACFFMMGSVAAHFIASVEINRLAATMREQ